MDLSELLVDFRDNPQGVDVCWVVYFGKGIVLDVSGHFFYEGL